jgi:GNAT superfamily N-acetyltransferase
VVKIQQDMNVIVKRLSRDEMLQANRLYNASNTHERTATQFQWEFYDAPAGEAIYVAAVDIDKPLGEQVIGTQCAIPIHFTDADDNKILTAKSEDTFLDPAYRGQKLFDKMYALLFEECKKEGVHFIWGFTYAEKPFKKVSFEIPFHAHQVVLVTKPLKAYQYLSSLNSSNNWKEKVKIAGLCVVSYLKQSIHFASHSNTINFSNTLLNKNELIKPLLQSIFKTSISQDEAYTNWRFIHNPFNNNYREITFSNQSGKTIFNLTCNIRPEGFAYIEQFLFDSSVSDNEAISLLKQAINLIKQEPISVIRFWGFNHHPYLKHEIERLEKAGFFYVKKGIGFVWKDMKTFSHNLNPKAIYVSRTFTQGDS